MDIIASVQYSTVNGTQRLRNRNILGHTHSVIPAGVEGALELVGTPTLPDTLRATALHGVVCFTGMLSNQWTVRDFYPIEYLPRGVRLTAYSGEAADLPAAVLQSFLDTVAAGRLAVPLHRTYTLDEISAAHAWKPATRPASSWSCYDLGLRQQPGSRCR
jgi:NADPH2:quinone reductase